MNANVSPTLPASTSADGAERETRQLDHAGLVKALAAIRADSEQGADRYLTDTVVPHGGE